MTCDCIHCMLLGVGLEEEDFHKWLVKYPLRDLQGQLVPLDLIVHTIKGLCDRNCKYHHEKTRTGLDAFL